MWRYHTDGCSVARLRAWLSALKRRRVLPARGLRRCPRLCRDRLGRDGRGHSRLADDGLRPGCLRLVGSRLRRPGRAVGIYLVWDGRRSVNETLNVACLSWRGYVDLTHENGSISLSGGHEAADTPPLLPIHLDIPPCIAIGLDWTTDDYHTHTLRQSSVQWCSLKGSRSAYPYRFTSLIANGHGAGQR